MVTKRLALAVGLLACIAVPVTAGMWSNYPTVGVAAHCASTNQPGGPGTPTNCTTTVPAGPTSVTGLETVPADTNAAQGQAPQEVTLSMANLNALPVTVQAASTTANNLLSPTSTSGGYVLTAAGAISPTNVSLPPNAVDGQQFRISATQTIATLNVQGAQASANASGVGDNVSNAPTALTVSTTGSYGYQFKYKLADKRWYRIQ